MRRVGQILHLKRAMSALMLCSIVSLPATAPASAQGETTTVLPSDDGWYRPNPGCGTPAGCLDTRVPGIPTPNTSPYPEGTLHVGVTQGLESARSYLAFQLADTRIPTSGTLRIPVDGPESGTVLPETSEIAVCPFYGSITDEPGSMTAPPTPACEISAAASFDVETGTLVVDLDPLLTSLAFGAGLALLPNAGASQPTDSWHVAFSSVDRSESTAPTTEPVAGPAELSLTYATTAQPEPPPATPQPTTSPAPPSTPPRGTTSPIAPVAPALPPAAAPVEPPQIAPPTEAPPVATPQVPTARVVTTPYAYPVAVRLPFLLLVLGVLMGRSLTAELTPRRVPRETD